MSVVLPEDSGPKISTMRPRGTPPMPSARSRDSAPVGIALTFTWAPSSPMRMTVPLPNWRSICVSAPCRAASRAFAAFSSSVTLMVKPRLSRTYPAGNLPHGPDGIRRRATALHECVSALHANARGGAQTGPVRREALDAEPVVAGRQTASGQPQEHARAPRRPLAPRSGHYLAIGAAQQRRHVVQRRAEHAQRHPQRPPLAQGPHPHVQHTPDDDPRAPRRPRAPRGPRTAPPAASRRSKPALAGSGGVGVTTGPDDDTPTPPHAMS